MKYALTTIFFIGCLTAFAQKNIDGAWKGSVDSPDGTFELNYNFKAEGNVLTGLLKTQFGDTPLTNGKIDGKKLSFTISFDSFTMNQTGELINENEILLKNDMGEVKLTRVKE